MNSIEMVEESNGTYRINEFAYLYELKMAQVYRIFTDRRIFPCLLHLKSMKILLGRIVKIRRKKSKERKLRDKFRAQSPRHILTVEAEMTEDQKRHCFRTADNLRLLGNHMKGLAKKRLAQCFRRREYRLALETLRETKGKRDTESLRKRKEASQKLETIRKAEKLTLQNLIEAARPMRIHLGLNSVLAQKCAENVWMAVEQVLYGGGKKLHFKKRFELPVIQAKQIERTITIKVEDSEIILKSAWTGPFRLKREDDDIFIQEELEKVVAFLEDPEIEKKALELFNNTGEIIDTFRVCYVGLKCEVIRGKKRVFVQFTIEGDPLPKKKKDGSPRHAFGKGRIGIDLGTQSVAICTEQVVFLNNLAERSVKSSLKNEERIICIQKAMDRSQRALNPQNYNENRTVKRGKKTWKRSKRYNHLKERLRELQRKNAENRHLAIRETVNTIRTLGDEIFIENFNAQSLARKVVFDPTEPNKKRRRFGRSVQKRCPGYFFSRIQEVFEKTAGTVTIVDMTFRASQYDHIADTYHKKELSQRWNILENGDRVQRDLYSAFLLMNSSCDGRIPDRERCEKTYPRFKEQHDLEIERIKTSGLKIMNSGIEI